MKRFVSWICFKCRFKNYHNKTICYNCAWKRNYSKVPQQLEVKYG